MDLAFELAAAKNYVDAEKYLEAGWRLNDSLRSRPEVDLQIHAIEIDQKLTGLMRKLPVDPEWIPRLDLSPCITLFKSSSNNYSFQ
ncbi:hypothetical protein L0152_24230 [bacterium]|nr:hypothetical protein [bacterium]